MKNNKKNTKLQKLFNVIDYFKESALFLLLMSTLVLIITNILYAFKISINSLYLPFIYVISIIIFTIYRKKENIRKSTISIIIATIVFAGLIITAGKIYDITADGNTYHKLAVGALKNGWNPLYESVGDYNKDKGNPFDILDDNVNVKWVDHYARGTETFGAVVYAFTGNMETSKVFNMLWVYIGFFILFMILKQMKIAEWKSLLISAVMAFNPISMTHLTNLYLDGVLAISLFMIILICAIQVKWEDKTNERDNYLILAMAIIWCCNSKFTGLAFAAVFAGVLYLYRHIYNFIKNKKEFKKIFIKDSLFYIVTVLLAVLFVGNNTYTKNFIDYGHPFYPLYGKGHVQNMVNMEIPKSLSKESHGMQFLISIFSKGENVSPSYSDYVNNPNLKIPFTFTRSEIGNYNVPDIRVGGFGPLFSGLFVLTIIGTIYVLIDLVRKKEYDKLILYGILLLTTIILVLALDGSYWARYIPYVYLLPVYVLIYLMKKNKKVFNIISLVVISVFALNSLLILASQAKNTYYNNKYINVHMEEFVNYAKSKKTVNIKLNHHGVQGIQYNLDDLNINNYVLSEDESLEKDGYLFKY